MSKVASISSPDWDHLFEMAVAQDGMFTTRQAAEAGYSSQLLAHHLKAGRMIRIYRGVYRLVHFPAGDHEALSVIWLWSNHAGVFSHQTALALYDLSDVLPSQIHLTLPMSWKRRRLRKPDGVVLYYDDVTEDQRHWFGPVPATAPARTLNDCASTHLPPDLLQQAALDALHCGLVAIDELDAVAVALEPYGGIR